jgi:hypothetical protein
MDPQRTLIVLLVLAIVAGTARFLWFAWRRAPDARPHAWRIASLILLQLISACLLYRTLLPPPVASGVDALAVATAHTPRDVARTLTANEKLVALPEAPSIPGAERVPDIGTALRRHPATARLRVLGDGLPPRDRDQLHGMPLSFQPAPLPRGLVELSVPQRAYAGDDFLVRGRVQDARGGNAELFDPAGQRVDRQPLDAKGRFTLLGATRMPGLVDFNLRVNDAHGRRIEAATIPLAVDSPAATRVLVLAGAPDAELKYLRRWAVDSGVRMTAQIQLGGGVQLGDPPIAFNAATLKGFDAVILDERTWDGLGDARRRIVSDAVRNGLGLLVRATAPPSTAGQRTLASLGLQLAPTSIPPIFQLPVPENGEEFIAARLGPGSHDAPTAATTVDTLPELTRPPLRIGTSETHAWLFDKQHRPLAAWHALGRGRVGAWLPMDTFQLVLVGREDLHAGMWSDAIANVARATVDTTLSVPHDARQGTRVVLCGVADDARVVPPDSHSSSPLLIDPATGPARCAGFWPTSVGWHSLHSGKSVTSFFVRSETELPGVAAQQLRDATAQLTLDTIGASAQKATIPGSRWPWFLAWLLVSVAVWWLERARLGRREPSRE